MDNQLVPMRAPKRRTRFYPTRGSLLAAGMSAAALTLLLAACSSTTTGAETATPPASTQTDTAEQGDCPAATADDPACDSVDDSAADPEDAAELQPGTTSTDPQTIYDACYRPSGSVKQVTSNSSITNELLADYPTEWSAAVPVPTAPITGVCHQTAGSVNIWWIHLEDPQAGYDAALAWNDQLTAAGSAPTCSPDHDLSVGPTGTYSCAYLVGAVQANINNSQGPVELSIQLIG